MVVFPWETIDEIDKKVALRFKAVRKRKGFTQKRLAALSNVSYGSLKKFEQTGEISLTPLTKLASTLGVIDEINKLFSDVPYADISEVIYEREHS